MAEWLDRLLQELEHWRRRDWTFEEVGEHWDSTEEYDEINEETYSYFRRFEDGLRLSDLQDGGLTLDVCARTGKGSVFFYEQGKVGKAVCADVSFKMGEICQRRLREAGVPDWMWVPLNDYVLPFRAESFENVLCFETVEHFSQPARLISELGRVTQPGGNLILTTPNILWEPVHALAAVLGYHHSEGPHRFVRLRALKRMVEQAGFAIDHSETTVLIPGGPQALVRLGEWFEVRTRRTLMPVLGLRRVLVATKGV